MTKAIIFDLDGTLIDSAPDIHAAANKMLVGEGHAPLDLKTITSFIGNGLPKLVERCMGVYGIDMSDHARLTQITLEIYSAASSDLTVPYPGLMELLPKLKSAGYIMGVCTNKPEAPARDILRDLAMEDYFDVVIGGDSTPVKKPDPAPLIQSFEALNADMRLYVGDSEVDAETADRAGIDFALFTEGYRKTPANELPQAYRFDHFDQLEDIITTHFRGIG